MTKNEKEFNRIKRDVDDLKEQHAKAIALKDDRLEKLKTNHGCKTLTAARKKHKQLKEQLENAEQIFDERFDNFKTEHGESVKAISG